jgi:sorting and assembly machinery component 37
VSKKEMEFRRARWLWMAGAGGAMIVYLLASGLVQVGYLDGNIIEDAGDEMAGDGVDEIVWVLEEEDDEH